MTGRGLLDAEGDRHELRHLLGLIFKLRGGGGIPVAVAAPVTAPAAPHAALPVGAAGTTPAVPAYGRTDPAPGFNGHGAADGHGVEWAGAAGPEQPGARENGRSVREEGSAGTRESARPVPTAAGSCGNTGQPPERAGVPGDAPAPPLDYEPRWFCVTCDDGHIGPCDALPLRRRPMLLRLLDLIGRPA